MNKDLKKIGKSAYSAIVELVEALNAEWSSPLDDEPKEAARIAIQEDALSVQVRSGWVDNVSDMTADEYCILLATGGPAVRIVGQLESGEVTSARLEVQDWGTPWTEYTAAHEADLLAYVGCFYFGE